MKLLQCIKLAQHPLRGGTKVEAVNVVRSVAFSFQE
jgi:hypothetical protein